MRAHVPVTRCMLSQTGCNTSTSILEHVRDMVLENQCYQQLNSIQQPNIASTLMKHVITNFRCYCPCIIREAIEVTIPTIILIVKMVTD